MRKSLLRKSRKYFLLCFVLFILPVCCFAEEEKEHPFPYFMKDVAERKMVYPYTFDEVWNAVLLVSEDMNKASDKLAQEKRIKELKKDIKSDKNSGLIIVMNSHKGSRGFFSMQWPAFSTTVFYIKPLEGQKTQVYCRRINYCSYNWFIMDAYGSLVPGRFLLLTPVEGKILNDIENKLMEQSNEKRES